MNTNLQETQMNTRVPISTELPSTPFKPTFFRQVLGELLKFWKARSNIWLIAITLFVVLLFSYILFNELSKDDMVHTAGKVSSTAILTSIFPFCFITILTTATLLVTTEYSHNTMRQTVLAYPKRCSCVLTKLVAVFISALIIEAVSTLMVISIGYMFGIQPDFSDGQWWVLTMVLILPGCLAILSMSLGYLVRSSAGAISLTWLLFFIDSILIILPMDFMHKYVLPFMPGSLLNDVLRPVNDGFSDMFTLIESADHDFIGHTHPVLGFLCILVWSFGFLVLAMGRFRKSDI
ncbi:ABC transporter permease [Actinotignum urinale]|uniref:ABC transporter permease n=1 Tax=Actinotignum urinale TaxID=190146 RepID=A0ABU5G713_9ACTO|nr:ABC transporter permease [Actinotignum urinale]MDY5132977.1 ABC transporter permease [Actinotignum urinale]